MNITDRLARFAVCTGDVPSLVRQRGVLAIADSYATVVAGRKEPTVDVFHEALVPIAGAGGSQVVGNGKTMDPASAALLNGAAAHALDFDVISFAVSGFIGSATICALTALVEDGHEVAGKDVVTAYCVGWEAAAALARGINPQHYAKGWHPTATMGLMSATLACCRLLGLDVDATVSALAVAVADASGVKTMVGNMTNPYHVGKGARNAVIAAKLAAAGFQGHHDALGARRGFLNLFQGSDGYDPTAVTDSLAATWDLIEPGPVFKVHPCCGLIHSGLDAVIALREEHQITPDEVESVRVLVHEYVPRVMDVIVPRTGYQAKFSIPYCMAAALRDGHVGLDVFDDVEDDLVRLGERVSFEVHPELRGGETFFEKEFTDVEIRTSTGTFRHRVQRLENVGTGNRARPDTLRRKFLDCFRHAGVSDMATSEWDRVLSIDSPEPWRLWAPDVLRPLR